MIDALKQLVDFIFRQAHGDRAPVGATLYLGIGQNAFTQLLQFFGAGALSGFDRSLAGDRVNEIIQAIRHRRTVVCQLLRDFRKSFRDITRLQLGRNRANRQTGNAKNVKIKAKLMELV